MQSQSDLVRSEIISQIRAGDIFPGDFIDLNALRERFDVSGTPVRDAITRLEAEGLVERTPRSGVRIFRPDMVQLLGMLEVYAEIEGMAAVLAAKRADSRNSERIMKAVEACEQAVARPDFEPGRGYYALNTEFHLAIAEAAGNPDLTKLLHTSATRIIAFLRARHCLQGQAQQSAREHREIAETIIAHDGEAARALMIQHVRIDGASMLDTIKKMDERL